MHLTLVTGRFGKTRLVEGLEDGVVRPGSALAACMDYVRWEAQTGGATLVVTHLEIEPAFPGLSDVLTAHFNAIAGLDRYRDVRRLVVVGRTLLRDTDLPPMAAALFGQSIDGRYERA